MVQLDERVKVDIKIPAMANPILSSRASYGLTFPLATGLLHFSGSFMSALQSFTSFRQYIEEDARQKQKKATEDIIQHFKSRKFPLKMTDKNTMRFLIHWYGRISLSNAFHLEVA